MVKHLPAMRETQVQSLGREDLLEKEMATHSSSCLENPMDGGTWKATVHGVTWTWLSDYTHSLPFSECWCVDMRGLADDSQSEPVPKDVLQIQTNQSRVHSLAISSLWLSPSRPLFTCPNHSRVRNQPTRDRLPVPEPLKLFTSQSLTSLLGLTHSFLWKPQWRVFPILPGPSLPSPFPPGWTCPLLLRTLIINYLFNNSCFLICWPYYTSHCLSIYHISRYPCWPWNERKNVKVAQSSLTLLPQRVIQLEEFPRPEYESG